ncbi:Ca2+ regulator and membrane fusion protein Fig1-domain-containing protein [Aspergillus varians]
MENTDPESEKAGIGSQSTPPWAAESVSPVAPEIFSHAEPPASSSFPLLRKLRVDQKWKAKWRGRKRTKVGNKQQQGQQEEPNQDLEEGEEWGEEEELGEEESEGEGMEGSDNESIELEQISTPSSGSSYMDNNSSLWTKFRRSLRIFRIGFQRFVPQITFSHVLMTIRVVSIVLLSLLVAGCSSHRMRNIYLLELSYSHEPLSSSLERGSVSPNPSFYSLVANISSSGDLTVRVGYFGVCVATNRGGDNSSSWTCRPKATNLAEQVVATQDPLNLLAIGDNFRDQVIVSVIIVMSIILICLGAYGLSTFPRWREEHDADGNAFEVMAFPSQAVAMLVLVFDVLATLFLIVGILWQHVVVVAHCATAEAAFYGAVRGKVGAAAMGLGWGAIGVNISGALGLVLLIFTVRTLSQQDDTDDLDVWEA